MKSLWLALCLVLPLISGDRMHGYKSEGDSQGANMREFLQLNGKVADIKLAEENKHSLRFKVKLALEFKNTSDKPAILLKRDYWIGAETLAVSPEDSAAYKFIYSSSHWPSVYTSPEWVALRQKLDSLAPPLDQTRIIPPGEVFSYEAETILYIQKATSSNKTNQNWEHIKRASPVWLQVTLETWAINIEPKVDPQNPQFGKALQQRWKRFGELQLERLTSEPMLLTFP